MLCETLRLGEIGETLFQVNKIEIGKIYIRNFFDKGYAEMRPAYQKNLATYFTNFGFITGRLE